MTIIDSQVHAYEANTPKRPGTACQLAAHVTVDVVAYCIEMTLPVLV